MPIVSVTKCTSYDASVVERSLITCLAQLGGLEQFARAGERIFLKCNLVMPMAPDKAATTHPVIVAALAKMLKSLGAHAVIGDCPGYPLSESMLRSLYRTTGMEAAASSTGAQLNFDTRESTLAVAEGAYIRRIPIAQALLDCDGIINVAKLKTHGFTMLSAGVKNLFGVVPGLKKADFHLKMPEPTLFGEMLVDIATAVRPRLTVLDAVVSMEGAGPTRGNAVDTGVIAMSNDVYSLDVVASHLAGIDPAKVVTIAAAAKRGLSPDSLQGITITGENLSTIRRHFRLPPTAESHNPLSKFLPSRLADWGFRLLRPRPLFDESVCTGCATCVTHCPPAAISIKQGLPHVTLAECIRCFCCHELCPLGAVHIVRGLPGSLLSRTRRNVKRGEH